MPSPDAVLPDGYARFLSDLKERVRSARVRAQRVVNTSLSDLYWNIGERILAEQERQGWGSAVITRLAEDLRRNGPRSPEAVFAVGCPGLPPHPLTRLVTLRLF